MKAAVFLVLTGLLSACAPDRDRPGPPSVVIAVPAGSTVYSPDTLPFMVTASDVDAVGTLAVTFLDSTTTVETGFQAQVQESFRWPVPSRLQAGQLLTLSARATDVRGLTTVNSVNLTVIPRATASLFGR
jgi:hypothetical protein